MTPLPDDPAALIQLAQAALAPAGCLELTADVRQRAGIAAAQTDRAWTFTGRLEGGAWTVMEWTPVLDPEGGVTLNFGVGRWTLPFIPPLYGTLPSGEDGGLFDEAQDLFTGFTGMVEDDVTTSYAEADGDTVVLTQLFDQGLFRANQGKIVFDRESLRPRSLSLVVERPIDTESMGKLTDLDVEILLGPGGHPVSERFYGQGRAGPVRLRVTRELDYTSVRPCPVSPVAQ
ncbi:MAG: hypothetical protein IPO67_02295 [Deltaproteobacteria bacterium]|nr:hypothetical protein [Deltaproteobacteria bacterium]